MPVNDAARGEVVMNKSMVGMVIVCVLLCGCSAHIEPVLARRPLVEPLPLSVGVYFSPDIRVYRNKCEAFLCKEYDLGPPSVALFETVLAGMFERTVVLATMPPPESAQQVIGIIVPAIIHFNPLKITYQLSFYSRAGVELGAWEIDGSAKFYSTGAEQARRAMRDAAAKFVRELREQPVVKSWLKEAGVVSKETISNAPRPQGNEGAQP
jgi:hypothetical protein